jgi:hyperosmotically inducible periplasmic protein
MAGTRAWAAILAVGAMLTAASVVADEDARVVARVQQALVNAHIGNAENIQVQSFNGEVDLEGVVYSDRARERAGSVVAVVPGVTSVHNALTVQARADDDGDTTARVQAALAAAHLADVGPIQVSTFNGRVDLSGVVYSEAARAQLIGVVGAVRGVGSIGTTAVQVRDPP